MLKITDFDIDVTKNTVSFKNSFDETLNLPGCSPMMFKPGLAPLPWGSNPNPITSFSRSSAEGICTRTNVPDPQ